MKYLSEKTNKAYSSVEDLKAAEKEYDVKQAEVEKKNKDRQKRAKEIEDAYAFAKDTYNPFTLYTLDTLPDTDKNRGWFIEDMIQEESFNIIVGPAKSGKSAFSYGMAYCLQNGINFLDKKVEQCDVLYLDFEIDTRDIKIRLERLKKYYGDETKSFNIMPLIKNNFEFEASPKHNYSYCTFCGKRLTDGGYCPVCDDGAEDLTETTNNDLTI